MAHNNTYITILVLLLIVAVINNILMFYKCYINNPNSNPFVPHNTGVYRVNVYYNKYRTNPEITIQDEIKPYLQPFVDKTYGRYVVTQNDPTPQQYEQISALSNYGTPNMKI